MLKDGFYYLKRDLIDFICENKIKLIIILLIGLAGCGFGIASAYVVKDITVISNAGVYKFNIVLFIQGKRGIVGYFFIHLVCMLLVFSIMSLLSYRFLLALINVVVFFFFCTIYTRILAVTLIAFKISFLPVVIIGLVPTFLLYFCAFCCFIAYTFQKSYEFRYYGQHNYFYCIGQVFARGLILGIILLAICLVQTILVSILTLGITI